MNTLEAAVAAADAKVEVAAAAHASVGAQLREKELTVAQLEGDGEKLRGRLEEKEKACRGQGVELSQLRVKLDEVTAESARRERLLSGGRDEAAERQQTAFEAQQAKARLVSEAERLTLLLERRKAEAAEATEARAKAEALATTLRLQIEKAGLEGAGEALTLRDMAAVKSDSGVYEAIGKLPDVPVLQKLTESIDTATRSLNELRDEKLASMAVVGEIDADGPSATGSTEPAPMT